MFKNIIAIALSASLLTAASTSNAQAKKFGVGLAVGVAAGALLAGAAAQQRQRQAQQRAAARKAAARRAAARKAAARKAAAKKRAALAAKKKAAARKRAAHIAAKKRAAAQKRAAVIAAKKKAAAKKRAAFAAKKKAAAAKRRQVARTEALRKARAEKAKRNAARLAAAEGQAEEDNSISEVEVLPADTETQATKTTVEQVEVAKVTTNDAVNGTEDDNVAELPEIEVENDGEKDTAEKVSYKGNSATCKRYIPSAGLTITVPCKN